MHTVVRKYGGSSPATVKMVRGVARLVAEAAVGVRRVVISARGGTTDELPALVGEYGLQRTPREADTLPAPGGLAGALIGLGSPAVSPSGAQSGIRGVGTHGMGVIRDILPDRIQSEPDAGRIVVVTGFQAVDELGDVVTLGRCGSDTTAVALALGPDAERCEIYSDADGVRGTDPRIVADTSRQPEIDVGLMAEMSFAGAKVLHSRSAELAAGHAMEVHVRSTFPPAEGDGAGTIAPRGSDQEVLETCGVVVGVASDSDTARVLIESTGGPPDVAAAVLSPLARTSVPADLAARSGPYEEDFQRGFTIRRSDVGEMRKALPDWPARPPCPAAQGVRAGRAARSPGAGRPVPSRDHPRRVRANP